MPLAQLESRLAILIILGCLLAVIVGETDSDVLLNIGDGSTRHEEQVYKLSFRVAHPQCPRAPQYICDSTSKYRSINGACNNLQYPWWGQSNSPYKRLLSAYYDDGLNEPRTRSSSKKHSYLPNARTVTLDVFDDSSKSDKSSWVNLLLPHFAQLVSYDLSATVPSKDRNGKVEKCRCNSHDRDCFNIPTPKGDKVNKDQKCMSMVRSIASVREFDCNMGPREQLNKATHWLDLSVLYGSSQEEANNLRTFTGGLLKSFNNTRTGELYFALNQTVQCKYSKYSSRYYERQRCYITGDSRTEDNAVLTSLLTIFLRLHNSIATQLSTINPLWTDERIYQESRRIVIAIYQNIVYSEFLPAVIGKQASISFGLPTLKQGYFTRYSSSVYPQINNEFATAASRIFQTMLPLEQSLIGRNSRDKVSKSISFIQFNNQLYEKQMTPLFRGLLTDSALPIKPNLNKYLRDWLWNELFYDEDTKRWSLSALDIQQGRDHGLPGYNKYRKLCGLPEAKSFHDLTNIPDKIVQNLKRVYSSVDDIDLFVGLVSEKPLKNALVGQTAACIIGKQFRDLKFGDRFYFETSDPVIRKRQILFEPEGPIRFTPQQLDSIREVTLGQVIAENTGLDSVQSSVFGTPDSNSNPPLPTTNINLDLSSWSSPDGTYIDCTSLFTYNSTMAQFYYSSTNTSADFASFAFSLTNYESTGLPQASIDIKCFPLNRTAIVTITGNKASTNLDFGTFVAKTNNASILFYVFDTNSSSFSSFESYSFNQSTFALTIANVQSLVQFPWGATFETYDFSSATFSTSSAEKVYMNAIYLYSHDNSSVSYSISNINNLLFDNPVYMYAYLSDNAIANKTISNITAKFSNIKVATLDEFYGQWYIGGSAQLVFEDIDSLRFTERIVFYPGDSSTIYINLQILFVMRNIRQLISDSDIYTQSEDTCTHDWRFENIESMVLYGSLYTTLILTDPLAVTNISVSLRNISYISTSSISFSQTNAGNTTVEMIDIGAIETYSFSTSMKTSGSIDFRANLSNIDSFNLTDKVSADINSTGLASFNFEKISFFKCGLDVVSWSRGFLFNVVDVDQAELKDASVYLISNATAITFDRVRNLTVTNGIQYATDATSADKSSGQNSLVISNVQLFKTNRLTLNFANGLSSASLFNIGQMFVNNTLYFDVFNQGTNAKFNLSNIGSINNIPAVRTSSYNNSLATFNFGPGIQNLNAGTVTVNKDGNSNPLQWNLNQISALNIASLNGTVNGVANFSLFSVASTVINTIPATVNLPSQLLFYLYGQSNTFAVVTDPAGAGSTVKSIKAPSCTCSTVETY